MKKPPPEDRPEGASTSFPLTAVWAGHGGASGVPHSGHHKPDTEPGPRSPGLWDAQCPVGRYAAAGRLCAPSGPLPTKTAATHRQPMGDTGETRCVGRGDGTDCPNGEDETLVDGARCEECQHHYERDTTEPARRPVVDEGLTRPMGDPDEAGHRGTAA